MITSNDDFESPKHIDPPPQWIKQITIANLWKNNKEITINSKGPVTILTGKNGAGKSTTLEIIYESLLAKNENNTAITPLRDWACRVTFENTVSVNNYVFPNLNDGTNDLYSLIEENKETILTTNKNSLLEALNLIKKQYLAKKESIDKNFLLQSDEKREGQTLSLRIATGLETQETDALPSLVLFTGDTLFRSNRDEPSDMASHLDYYSKNSSLDKSLCELLIAFLSKEAQTHKQQPALTPQRVNEIAKKLIATQNFTTKISIDNDESVQDQINKSTELILAALKKEISQLILKEGKPAKEIRRFEKIVNKFFNKIGKKVVRSRNKFLAMENKNGDIVNWMNLSKGEKTLLALLLTTFLEKDNQTIFLFDEPDLSLHIEWQEMLIESLCTIAPNCQFFISTHSPALVMNGWINSAINFNEITN